MDLENQRGQYFIEEDRVKGGISCSVINRVIKGLGGYFWLSFLFIFNIIIIYCFYNLRLGVLNWGRKYVDQGIKDYSIIKGALKYGYIIIVAYMMKEWFYSLSGIWFSRKFHAKMTFRILHAKISEFLERIPYGRIINRFSRDVSGTDDIYDDYSGLVDTIFQTFLTCLIIVITAKSFYLFLPCTIYIILGFWLRGIYMRNRRDFLRLSSIVNSPTVGLMISGVEGGPTIRSMKKEEYIQKRVDY